MLYCPPNVTLSEVWVNHGTTQCFMDTVSVSVVTVFLFIAGTIQLCIYKKYATPIARHQLPRSSLYCVQLFVVWLVPILETTRFILQATVLHDKHIYGYMVSKFIFTVPCNRIYFYRTCL